MATNWFRLFFCFLSFSLWWRLNKSIDLWSMYWQKPQQQQKKKKMQRRSVSVWWKLPWKMIINLVNAFRMSPQIWISCELLLNVLMVTIPLTLYHSIELQWISIFTAWHIKCVYLFNKTHDFSAEEEEKTWDACVSPSK